MIKLLGSYHFIILFALWWLFSAATLWHVRSFHTEWADAEQLPKSIEHRNGMFKWLKMNALLHPQLRKRVPRWLLYSSFGLGWLFLIDMFVLIVFFPRGIQ